MAEPCSACRHSWVPAIHEPCLSCIVSACGVNEYTKFEPLPFAQAAESVGPSGAEFLIPASLDGYRSLSDVLARAFDQASAGKGAERHGRGLAFDEQPMQQLIRLYGVGFALGQAAKKAQEAQRLPTVERQVAELLGSINYLAGAVIALERGNG